MSIIVYMACLLGLPSYLSAAVLTGPMMLKILFICGVAWLPLFIMRLYQIGFEPTAEEKVMNKGITNLVGLENLI